MYLLVANIQIKERAEKALLLVANQKLILKYLIMAQPLKLIQRQQT
ncbi:MAG: hypothetical protein ACJAZQ_001663 [Cognaticolwellia sp.]